MSTSTVNRSAGVQGWSIAGAWALGLIGVAQLIAWGNRWYVSSMFARSAADEGGWQYAYAILDKAQQAMATGLVLLFLATALAWFATRGRAHS